MNLPIFARYIGKIVIGDLDCGPYIVSKLNACVTAPSDYFILEETGSQMLTRFRMLPVPDKRRIEELSLIDEDMWSSLVRQVDFLTEPDNVFGRKLGFRQSLYVMIALFELSILFAVGVGYYILLQMNDDRYVSRILGMLNYFMEVWKQLKT